MKTALLIHHHTGLGDHFNCAGMVRYLANKRDFSYYFVVAKIKYLPVVKYMYRDNPSINVVGIPSEPWNLEREFVDSCFLELKKLYQENNKSVDLCRVGHEHYPWGSPVLKTKNPWEIFYDQLAIDYSVRTDLFVWPQNKAAEDQLYHKLNPNNETYAFVHEDPSRGLLIDRSKIKAKFVIENPSSENPFFLRKLIECASEVHCIDSSIKCLVDLMPAKKVRGELFLHNVREYALGTLTNNWNIV
jgi:hypothetical protein